MFKSLSVNRVTFLLALFFVMVFNLPFFSVVKRGLEHQSHVDPIFVATIPVFLVALFSAIFSLFSFRYLLKPFFILLILLSSSVFFAAFKYGVVFDTGMIENTFETNSAEALTYLNWASVLNFLLSGLLPAALLYKVKIDYRPIGKELLRKLMFIGGNLLVVGVIAFVFMQNYASFLRNNVEAKRYIIPTYFIGSAAKYINQHYLQAPLQYRQLGTDAKVVTTAPQTKPQLLVMVVGETARAMNYQYYGYKRETNPYTAKYDLQALPDVQSCGTATAVSLPCMFSRMGRQDYDGRRAKAQDSIVDVLNHAGINLAWYDNDSGCKGVCDRVTNQIIDIHMESPFCDGQFCKDQVLVDKLKQVLAEPVTNNANRLIVLHIIGSHGPTYYLRYPDEYRKFTPDCPRSDIQNCSREELLNTYDNTILYTDYIVSEVIGALEQQTKYSPAMMYLSDHGESLGEKGLYLHGSPYSFAPKEQTTVPWLLWMPEPFVAANGMKADCITSLSAKSGITHDNLFDSLLGLFNVQTSVYEQDKDIFATCRNSAAGVSAH
ncbi:phosphoethanolamine transferase [Shewanella avicenniae]|uniref:phosphoethanolamine transferase n=1 Tax=Shewanella avicenniae TaxID=2814294 RepID=UPI001E2ADD34|nr:phosphoethanolamine--lipid A transferase [Shewanella avicenniae]